MSQRGRAAAVAGVIAALGAMGGGAARAAPPDPLPQLGLSFGTSVPVMVGGEVEYAGFRYAVPAIAIGYLPGGYVDVVNAFVDDEPTEALIKNSIQDSLALRFSLRSFPLRGWGLYGSFSYILYSLGGGVDLRTYLDAAGFDPPAQVPELAIPAESTVHLLSFGLGYRFWIIQRISVSVDLSFLFAVGSSTSVEQPYPILGEAVDTFLDDIYTTYIKAPVIGARVGYHLF